MNIHLHIEQLIIEGIDVADRHALETALQTELMQLLADEGMAAALANGGAWAALPTAKLSFSGNASSAQMGKDIAQAIYGGFGRE